MGIARGLSMIGVGREVKLMCTEKVFFVAIPIILLIQRMVTTETQGVVFMI